MDRVGVITGLASEAACLTAFAAAERPMLACAGASGRRAGAAARALIADGCAGLLSFGMAGGLDPSLAPGVLVIADRVMAPDGRTFATAAPWRARLVAAVGERAPLQVAAVAGSPDLITAVDAKRRLREATAAAAVDMESHAIAAAAGEAGIPFLVLRAVADPAERAVPAWVLAAVDDQGRLRPWAVAAGLAAQPWRLPAAIGLARESRRALAALRRVALLAGPRFGFG